MQGLGAAMEGVSPPQQQNASTTPATPEQEAQYSKFVGMSIMALADDKFMPQAEKMLNQSPSLPQAMAQIGAGIVQRIYQAAKQQGEPIDPTVLVHGGLAIMQKVGEFAQAAGKEVSPDDVETAYYMAADQMNDFLTQQGAFDDEMAAEDEDEFMAQIGEEPVANVRSKMDGARQKMMSGMMGGGN